jgi:hypothetical protein
MAFWWLIGTAMIVSSISAIRGHWPRKSPSTNAASVSFQSQTRGLWNWQSSTTTPRATRSRRHQCNCFDSYLFFCRGRYLLQLCTAHHRFEMMMRNREENLHLSALPQPSMKSE